MAPECQEKNAKGLAMVAVGLNKAAEEFMILDERTREDLAGGKYHDQRRGTFGVPVRAPEPAAAPAAGRTRASGPAARRTRQQPPAARPVRPAARPPWTRSQEKLALLYNEQGLRPGEIAAKLGVSAHLVTQIILAARNRGKA